ncbi:hypothetical protein TNIN_389651 [Trichonephila inaurata madagascariensis]|uniref:Uncharacterized protein n=1 Tax=Trichonephila inaurata madagascariensis TaxID=2747483 RepID=A0A8X7BWW2_9ARAC|nr:hypothetical protein TNIN_389651 [Trichonephila inaurata madagascariensis]
MVKGYEENSSRPWMFSQQTSVTLAFVSDLLVVDNGVRRWGVEMGDREICSLFGRKRLLRWHRTLRLLAFGEFWNILVKSISSHDDLFKKIKIYKCKMRN